MKYRVLMRESIPRNQRKSLRSAFAEDHRRLDFLIVDDKASVVSFSPSYRRAQEIAADLNERAENKGSVGNSKEEN